MNSKAEIRQVLNQLRELFENQPSEFDKINRKMDRLEQLAATDWDSYQSVLEEDGVGLLLDESESQHIAKAQYGEMMQKLGLEVEATDDNIAAAYHAIRLEARAQSSTVGPKTRTGDPIHDAVVWHPHDKQSLANMLRSAHTLGRRVSVIGSYRSLSDAPDVARSARPGATLIVTSFLNKLIHINKEEALYTCEPGRAIWQVNADLEAHGLAMPNLGGGDFQTVAGAISTATHGSGIGFADFSMFVQEFELLLMDDQNHPVFRTFRRGEPDFDAVIVSMGTMGVITSLTLKVQPAFYLEERRTLMPWSEARKLVNRYVKGQLNVRHFEVLVSPYKTPMNLPKMLDADDKPYCEPQKEAHLCLVTQRWEVPKSETAKSLGRPPIMKIGQRGLGRWAARVALDQMLHTPNTIPARIAQALASNQVERNIDLSWKVLKLGLLVEASAAEYGVPAADAVKAADTILALAEKRLADGGPSWMAGPEKRREFWSNRAMHTSPISLRFVKAGSSLLSMNHDRDSCMIEVPMLVNNKAEQLENQSLKDNLYDAYQEGRNRMFLEIFHALEEALKDHNGKSVVRPHWGLENHFGEGTDWVESRWQEYQQWKKAYDTYNASGIFNCALTDRLKISRANR